MDFNQLKNELHSIMVSVHNTAVESAENSLKKELFNNAQRLAVILDDLAENDEKFVYALLEEYNNDGEIECNIIGTFETLEKAQERMKDHLKIYETYGVFEESDFELMTQDETSLYIYAESDDYYGKLDIIKQKIE